MRSEAIYTKGMGHKSPIPAAKVRGNTLVSSLITGYDADKQLFPAELEEQSRLMFLQIAEIMQQAGGSLEDIIQVRIWLNDRRDRDVFAQTWLEFFPDPLVRPARVTLNRDLGGDKKIECEIMAVLNA